MTEFRWTLQHLETAERALARHRAKIESGERDRGCLMPGPSCDRGCDICDLTCAVIAGGIETTRRGLAEQARAGDHAWLFRHGGRAFVQAEGNA